MPKFETIRRVPYSPSHMYAVVADVERYPEFLPLIEELKVISTSKTETTTRLEADMTIGYKAINETFRSEVLLNPSEKSIVTTSSSGPFAHMENRWQFKSPPAGDPAHATNARACDVHFRLDYKFKSWMLEKLMGQMFEKAFRTYAESFEKRAGEVPEGPPPAAATA